MCEFLDEVPAVVEVLEVGDFGGRHEACPYGLGYAAAHVVVVVGGGKRSAEIILPLRAPPELVVFVDVCRYFGCAPGVDDGGYEVAVGLEGAGKDTGSQLYENDLEGIKKKAMEKIAPSQSLVSSMIHQYVEVGA